MSTLFKSSTTLCLVGLVWFTTACDGDLGVACTEEFRSVLIELTGGDPDEVYTLRSSTGDTLRFNYQFGDDFFTVIDDTWQEELEGTEESFVFEAVVDGTVVVSETFVIEADQCHINKVSGAESASLD